MRIELKRNPQQLGRSAERLARLRLENRGFEFVASNWRCESGEIDLVMLDGEHLVFIEVKARYGEVAGSAEHAVDEVKAGRLLESGEWFLGDHPEHQDRIWRIDLFALTLDSRGAIARETHVKNAFFEE